MNKHQLLHLLHTCCLLNKTAHRLPPAPKCWQHACRHRRRRRHPTTTSSSLLSPCFPPACLVDGLSNVGDQRLRVQRLAPGALHALDQQVGCLAALDHRDGAGPARGDTLRRGCVCLCVWGGGGVLAKRWATAHHGCTARAAARTAAGPRCRVLAMRCIGWQPPKGGAGWRERGLGGCWGLEALAAGRVPAASSVQPRTGPGLLMRTKIANSSLSGSMSGTCAGGRGMPTARA